MTISPLTTSQNQLKGGLYLPSIGFGFLLINCTPQETPMWILAGERVNVYLWGFALTLISAVVLHEFIESYSGPSTGLFERVPAGKTYQSIGYTMYKAGMPEEYPQNPKTPPWEYEVEVPWWRYPLVFATVILTLNHFIAYPYTIIKLSKYAMENSSLPSGTIAFASTVLILRLFLTRLWPNTYLYWEEDTNSEN